MSDMRLKIPRSKGRLGSIPVRAPNKSRACMRFFVQALCFLHRKNSDRSAILFFTPPLASCQRPENPRYSTAAKPLAPHSSWTYSAPVNTGLQQQALAATMPNAARPRVTMSLGKSLRLFSSLPTTYLRRRCINSQPLRALAH